MPLNLTLPKDAAHRTARAMSKMKEKRKKQYSNEVKELPSITENIIVIMEKALFELKGTQTGLG